ncbi:GMC family oxidoreductase [Tropicibacter sp. Alg240-R139]|uniref:GMC family oxidoreductase n=1 Tax=Tropicibacter sp. Alg240-R139 TaxID=2305991 RepID=UPI0013DF4559|nr:GMC family oxidoreductase N-terminal domain-containing protein [Tropicibacter sp. Alg240-R139]
MRTVAFDYVIVGGGAAGCVLAARLAIESNRSVVLLERGRQDINRWIHIPATFFKAIESQDADVVVSDPDRSLGGRPFPVPQGNVLGGGSSVNGMIYMRGQHQDYDDWADLHGCTGWRFDDVLPVFKRQEANTRLTDPYHGKAGKLIVADPSAPHPLTATIVEAAQSAGLPETDDFNGERQDGAGWYQVTASEGQRQSSATCFLRPELDRENLTVLTNHLACRIRIENRRAVAVEALDEAGLEVLIEARCEIVLTAGSFHSPKLLMLSGIGPRDELQRHGIEIVHEADEVGRNLQDHVGAPVTRRLIGAKGLHGADRGFSAVRHGIDFFGFRRGLLTSNLLEAGACVDTQGSGRPDVQFNFAPFAPDRPGKPPLPFHAVQIHPTTMRPKSHGRLGLKSRDAADAPKFSSRVLSEENDLDTLRRGVRMAREIFDQSQLRAIVGEEIWPGPMVQSAIGSNTLDDAIREQARTIFHPAGTCRMGPSESSVVDPYLRVNGVDGLRVSDCSVMPALVSGNTNAPTMMIADRAADFILNER